MRNFIFFSGFDGGFCSGFGLVFSMGRFLALSFMFFSIGGLFLLLSIAFFSGLLLLLLRFISLFGCLLMVLLLRLWEELSEISLIELLLVETLLLLMLLLTMEFWERSSEIIT